MTLPDMTLTTETLVIWEVAYKTNFTQKYKLRKPYQRVDPSLIKAFMPGNIQAIYVLENTTVKKHEKLLVLEAMKMKNMILAPFDGIVKSVHVKAGDLVPKDFILIEISAL